MQLPARPDARRAAPVRRAAASGGFPHAHARGRALRLRRRRRCVCCRCCRSASSSGSRVADRLGTASRAGLPAPRRRAAGQHGAAARAAPCRCATLLAVALAWLTERTDLPGARLWAWLAVAPLAVPAFVHSYAWVSLVPGLHGLSGGVLVSVLAYFPFLYLPVAATLRRLDPALEDAAASLGLGPGACSSAWCCRSCGSRICGGALLVGAAPAGRVRPLRDDPLRHLHHRDHRPVPVRPINGPAANMLAGVLVACCLVLLGLEGAVARQRALRPRRLRRRRDRAAPAAWAGHAPVPARSPALTALLALGVPLVTLAPLAGRRRRRRLAHRRDRLGARPDAAAGARRRPC